MLRIVSLIASATEIIHSLGLGQFQVGRSHECDYPESVRQLPVCTRPSFETGGSSRQIDQLVKQQLASAASIYEVFPDVLDSLEPTHILTQTQCKVCAVSLDDVERALGQSVRSRPQIVALEPNCLADVWSDIARVGDACGISDTASQLVADLLNRITGIAQRARAASSCPRVACIEWLDPLMAAGNWVPELVNLANAENLFGEPGKHSPWLTWRELSTADPDIIIAMPCGFDLEKTEQEMRWMTCRPEWRTLRAVHNNQVYLADGNQYMNRPGPRVVESLQILAEVAHPGAFPPALEGKGWKRFSV
ncbi:MAG: cobalamin-binding protein [Acidobacteriaceae bacterium]|nr:cobalamin-binding protein [Acidobacteriaceae bacterium]